MAQHYPSLDLDPSLFHNPPSPIPTPAPLPAYHTDPPPSYFNIPQPPPSYSYSSPQYHSRPIDHKKSLLSSQPITSFPDDGISFAPTALPPNSVQHPARDTCRSASRITIAHPYARLYAKKDGSKRRKIWNHVLEKQLFSPQELSVYLSSKGISTFNVPFLDPPWVRHTGVPYISLPSKHT